MSTNKKNSEIDKSITPAPPQSKQATAKKSIIEIVLRRLENRIDEVFEMADFAQPGEEVAWDNIGEIRWQICGSVAVDLEYGLGEEIEEDLRSAFSAGPVGEHDSPKGEEL